VCETFGSIPDDDERGDADNYLQTRRSRGTRRRAREGKIDNYEVGRIGLRSEGRGLLVSAGGSKPKAQAPNGTPTGRYTPTRLREG